MVGRDNDRSQVLRATGDELQVIAAGKGLLPGVFAGFELAPDEPEGQDRLAVDLLVVKSLRDHGFHDADFVIDRPRRAPSSRRLSW